MSDRPAPRRLAAVALTVAFLLSGTVPAVAVDANGYPSWDEVRAAQASESAAEAEYGRLESALSRARTEAESAATEAEAATAAAGEAERALRAASDREIALKDRAARAEADLEEHGDALGRMASWLYINGTGLASTSELAASENPEEFMGKLSTATQVSGTWSSLAARAEEELNTASSLEEQAAAAQEERARLAAAAEEAAADATASQRLAEAAVATALDRSDTVYAQLAALRGTSSDVERRYQIGQQVAAQQEAEAREREEAARRARESGESGGSGGGGGGGGGSTGVDPAGAQAYARSVLGAYGWGDEQFSCLVALWNGESGWRADALNPSSGAYGIPQSLPAEKMAVAGADWRTNGNTQVDWGLAYIQAAYGSPCDAWGSWQSRDPHWY
ncbi:hypothetical protein MUN78_07970 [Leucobacter allii]|uniref:Lytic transglycosylase domain-containing protein n=1 Tax=Leucobacter allii TaxID=2932247 RepID=A0ABY4FR28_9MICO|nr:hypothetical protein [Leucobacter allii]UOQ58745.1 hypothetical protein MUN78_07970 [Leucobacter allii]